MDVPVVISNNAFPAKYCPEHDNASTCLLSIMHSSAIFSPGTENDTHAVHADVKKSDSSFLLTSSVAHIPIVGIFTGGPCHYGTVIVQLWQFSIDGGSTGLLRHGVC